MYTNPIWIHSIVVDKQLSFLENYPNAHINNSQ